MVHAQDNSLDGIVEEVTKMVLKWLLWSLFLLGDLQVRRRHFGVLKRKESPSEICFSSWFPCGDNLPAVRRAGRRLARVE